jgi:hypothetical protein
LHWFSENVASLSEAAIFGMLDALQTEFGVSVVGDTQKPKVLVDFAAKYTALKARLDAATKAAGNAEAVAVDERSAHVQAIVVDYVLPGNTNAIVVEAEVRAARQLIEHVTLAQDQLVDDTAARMSRLEDANAVLKATLADVLAKMQDGFQEILQAGERDKAALLVELEAARGEIAEVASELAELREDAQTLVDRPHVVDVADLKAHDLSAQQCRAAGYNANALHALGGYSLQDLKDGGYPATELAKSGLPLSSLIPLFPKALDYKGALSVDDFGRFFGLTTIAKFKEAGWAPVDLVWLFTAQEIRSSFSLSAADMRPVFKARFGHSGAAQAKDAGMPMTQLRGWGFTYFDLCNTGGPGGEPYPAIDLISNAHGNTTHGLTTLAQWPGGNWAVTEW